MKYFLSFFLFLTIACRHKTDSAENSNTKTHRDLETHKTEIEIADNNCIDGIKKARSEIKKNTYKIISYGIAGASKEYIEVMKQDYNIEVENIGCETDGSQECYNSLMDSAINAKFGKDIFLIANIKADSLASARSRIPKLKEQKADEVPQFKGGEEKLSAFIKLNLNYPSSAIKNKIHGLVFVQFTIDKEGNISETTILKGLSHDIDKESLRVLKLMPKWRPAKLEGKNISYIMRMPIRFSIDNS